MNHERILSILYDMALVIGGEVHVAPLLTRTLQRFMYHTTFPCGMVLLFPEQEEAELPRIREGVHNTMRLGQAIGDHRLIPHAGEMVTVPPELLAGPPKLLRDGLLLHTLPVRRDYYTAILRLPIPGVGVVVLLTPEAPATEIALSEIFTPVLSNLAKAVHLCRRNEALTEALTADRDLARSQLVRFRSALDRSDDLVFLIDPATKRLIDFNRTVVNTLGYTEQALYAFTLGDLAEELTKEQVETFFECARHGRESCSEDSCSELTVNFRTCEGREFPVEVRAGALGQGDEWLMIAVARDITERRQAEKTLDRERGRALVTLRSLGEAVITTDSYGRVDYLNLTAEALTAWSTTEARGVGVDEVCRLTNEITGKRTRTPVATVLSENRIVGQSGHVTLHSRDGRSMAIEGNAAPIRDREGAIIGAVMVMRDVSRTREMAARLSWQASHDALTGLINRREFENHLNRALTSARDRGHSHVLLYLDLDQFKLVNDTCGHMAGDELLKQLADLLRIATRENDVLARLGGDEFGLLLTLCPLDKAVEIAEKLRNAINEFRFAWQKRVFEIGVSIGLAVMDSMSESVAATLSAADMACYAAKERGRNRIHCYEPNDLDLVQRRGEMQRATEITEAIKENRFQLFFQPIFPIGDEGYQAHHEVLLRMHARDGALLAPDSFIPAAERYNLMPAIDRLVIRELFSGHGDRIRENFRLQKEAAGDGGMTCVYAVNLSGSSLADEYLFDFIRAHLAINDIPPQAICFEVTETAAITNLSKASRLIRDLRKHGCRFSLDDFGSGLSSFGYLKNLPVDFLKIDGSFVKDIVDDPIDFAMVGAINHIGHVMGIHTIAEFVETPAILQQVKKIGVDYAQGFAVGKPQPLAVPVPPNLLPPLRTPNPANV